MNRRSLKTKAAIREAFTSLLTQKPFEKITVTEIARLADIDRKTYYLHYESVDALMDELIGEEADQLCDILADVSINKSGQVNVLELFKQLEGYIAANIDQRTSLMRYANVDQMLSKLEPVLVSTIIEKDSLKLAETLGPYLGVFVSFFYSGLITMYKRYLERDSDLPLEDLAALASAALAGGITALTAAASNIVDGNKTKKA